ncbi:hypothetical protein [Paenibacillus yonginensis]|uniref:hypothetical protein n=1 Tax=Paenibacillus yonginensis TaxID=1462996 RepID=UPI00147209AB|nr:hypothetical protein [Paenibacillus yonginensis]
MELRFAIVFLKEAGFEIVTCMSGKAACMSALDETPVDVVLMDIMLGDTMSSCSN